MGLVIWPVFCDSVATALKGCLKGLTVPTGVVAEEEVITGPAILS